MQNEPNFGKAQMNVNLYNTMDYEEKSDWTPGENEPKTNPIKPNFHFTAENAEYAEKKDICVSDCSIEKYALSCFSVFWAWPSCGFANSAVNPDPSTNYEGRG